MPLLILVLLSLLALVGVAGYLLSIGVGERVARGMGMGTPSKEVAFFVGYAVIGGGLLLLVAIGVPLWDRVSHSVEASAAAEVATRDRLERARRDSVDRAQLHASASGAAERVRQAIIAGTADQLPVTAVWPIERSGEGFEPLLDSLRRVVRLRILPRLRAALAEVPELRAYTFAPYDSLFSYRFRRWEHIPKTWPAYLSARRNEALLVISGERDRLGLWASDAEEGYWGALADATGPYRAYKVDHALTTVAIAVELQRQADEAIRAQSRRDCERRNKGLRPNAQSDCSRY